MFKFFFIFLMISTSAFAEVEIILKNANLISHDEKVVKVVSADQIFIINKKLIFKQPDEICNNDLRVLRKAIINIKKASKKQQKLKCLR